MVVLMSGGCLGHTVCTGAAVLVGMIVARFISARVITFIGALVFIGFAIASIFIDPNKDGIDGIPDIPVIHSHLFSETSSSNKKVIHFLGL